MSWKMLFITTLFSTHLVNIRDVFWTTCKNKIGNCQVHSKNLSACRLHHSNSCLSFLSHTKANASAMNEMTSLIQIRPLHGQNWFDDRWGELLQKFGTTTQRTSILIPINNNAWQREDIHFNRKLPSNYSPLKTTIPSIKVGLRACFQRGSNSRLCFFGREAP